MLRNTRDPQTSDQTSDLVKAAAIDSKGKFEQTYGYFEASVRIAPTADGMHTAFWLQNDNRDRTAADGGVDGPSDGAEIDILESVYVSNHYTLAVHWEGNSHAADLEFAPMHDGQFHVFAVAWTPDSYTFYADDQLMVQRYQGLSHSDGYVILSTGLSWRQGNAHTGTFPNEALVDWVRVYELQDAPVATPVVLEPPDSRGTRDIGRIILVSSQPGTIQASWEAPTEEPADYRISWAKESESFKTWTDNTGNAFPTEPSCTITGLEGGERHKAKVRARYDGSSGDWSGEAVITVAASSANAAPTADAGSDQIVQEGSAVTLSGTASDPDNDTLTYQWTHDRGDLGISLGDPAALSTTFAAPQVDSDTTITFTLTATDEHGAAGSDAVAVTIQDVPADPPTSGGGLVLSPGVVITVQDISSGPAQGNTVVLEPPDPRDSRDIGRITLVSSQPGTIQASWEAPTEEPADYRISWAKESESFKTWTDNTGNAFPAEPSYTITGLEGGEKHKAMVRARFGGSSGDWSGEAVITVMESQASKPVVSSLTFGLGENYPNPFNPVTRIAYTLSTAGPVELAIYNVLGQRVRILVQEIQAAGSYQVAWNGRNDSGAPVASGIYLYRLSTTQEVQTRRLLLLK